MKLFGKIHQSVFVGVFGLILVACGGGGGAGGSVTVLPTTVEIDPPTSGIFRLLGAVELEFSLDSTTNKQGQQIRFSQSDLGTTTSRKEFLITNTSVADFKSVFICLIYETTEQFFCLQEFEFGLIEMFIFMLGPNNHVGQGDYVECGPANTIDECFNDLVLRPNGRVRVRVTNNSAF